MLPLCNPQERTFVYLAQLALRGRGEKKKERWMGLDLTTFTGKTVRWKSLKVSVTEAET